MGKVGPLLSHESAEMSLQQNWWQWKAVKWAAAILAALFVQGFWLSNLSDYAQICFQNLFSPPILLLSGTGLREGVQKKSNLVLSIAIPEKILNKNKENGLWNLCSDLQLQFLPILNNFIQTNI